ncbi:unnamed protein product [Closterium sp. NIES-53]
MSCNVNLHPTASGGAELGGAEPGGAESEGAGSGGAEPGCKEPGGAEPVGVELGGAEPEGVEPGRAESEGAESGDAELGVLLLLEVLLVLCRDCFRSWRLSPRSSRVSGLFSAHAFGVELPAPGVAGAGGTGAGGTGTSGTGAGGTGTSGAGAGGVGAGGAGAGGTGEGGAGAGGAGAVDIGDTVRPRPYFFPLLQQVLGVPSFTSLTPPLLCPPPDQSQLPLQLASPLPTPPSTEESGGLTERPRTFSVPLRVPLPPGPESSHSEFPDPGSDHTRTASPTVSCLFATVVSDPSFESTAASVLVVELLDFAAACRLDYATALAAEFESCPAALGFAPSTADPSLSLRTDTLLPSFYVLVYVHDLIFATADIKALTLITRDRAWHTITLTQSYMLHQSVEPSGPYPELVGCLMYVMTCTRPDLAYPLSLLARYVAPVRRAWCSCLEDGVQLSSQVTQALLGSSCEAEIYAGAMAAKELCWLTYLLTDLGEQPRSPPVLYVDNKALCQEHRLEHRMKHIAMRYFLARELQQRGQLRLAYMATRANTADIFTKALPPGDHQRFSTVLGLLALLFLTGLVTTCFPPLFLWGYSRNVRFGTTLYAL